MFTTFLKFEFKYWFSSPTIYIFFLVSCLMAFLVTGDEGLTVGSGTDNCNFNSPYAIQTLYVTFSMLCGLMVTTFVCAAAIRDFRYETAELIFVQPTGKFSYLAGRFCASTIIAMVPMLAIAVGSLAGEKMPWLDQQRIGDTAWAAHGWGLFMFAIPNTAISAMLIFALALRIRKTAAAFVAILALIVANLAAANLIRDLSGTWLGSLLDPFGISTFSTITRYWTIADKNSLSVGWNELLISNRLIWLGAGAMILVFSCCRFPLLDAQKKIAGRIRAGGSRELPGAFGEQVRLPDIACSFDAGAVFRQWYGQVKTEFRCITRSPVFLVITGFAMINLLSGMLGDYDESFGVKALPVTFRLVEIIRSRLEIFLIVLIAFYVGAAVWRERDSRLDEMLDSLPASVWSRVLSRVVAILAVVATLQGAAILLSMTIQLSSGFTQFQVGVFARELLGFDFVRAFCLVALALFSHTVAPNKHAGYAIFILLGICNSTIWPLLGVESYLVRFGQLPEYIYSDMFGLSPYLASLNWFGIYQILFGSLMIVGSIAFWKRGLDHGL